MLRKIGAQKHAKLGTAVAAALFGFVALGCGGYALAEAPDDPMASIVAADASAGLATDAAIPQDTPVGEDAPLPEVPDTPDTPDTPAGVDGAFSEGGPSPAQPAGDLGSGEPGDANLGSVDGGPAGSDGSLPATNDDGSLPVTGEGDLVPNADEGDLYTGVAEQGGTEGEGAQVSTGGSVAGAEDPSGPEENGSSDEMGAGQSGDAASLGSGSDEGALDVQEGSTDEAAGSASTQPAVSDGYADPVDEDASVPGEHVDGVASVGSVEGVTTGGAAEGGAAAGDAIASGVVKDGSANPPAGVETESPVESKGIDPATAVDEAADETLVATLDAPPDGWVDLDGARYYYLDGVPLTGQRKIDDKWYYFDPAAGGAMATGFVELPAAGKTVYYGDDGAMRYGQQRIGGSWYYLTPGTGAMRTGFVDLGSKTCYYDDQGRMQYGQRKVDGSWYYLTPGTGARAQSAFVDLSGKTVYYGPDGAMRYGQQKIDGYWYYFGESTGAMRTGFVTLTDAGKTCYYDDQGRMQYGQRKVSDKWYYLRPGSGARAESAFVELPSKTVYYGSDGAMRYGQQRIAGSWYLFAGKTGAMRTGFVDVPGADKTCYYDDQGRMRYGQQKVDGAWYYLRPLTGSMVRDAFVTIDGQTIAYGKTVSSKTCYYDADGRMHYGFLDRDGCRYYLEQRTGARAEEQLVTTDGQTYWFDANGDMARGEANVNGTWKYFDLYTGALCTREQTIDILESAMRAWEGSYDGYIFEDALLEAGGSLCWGWRGEWCGTYLWWIFREMGVSHLHVDGQMLVEPQAVLDWYTWQGQAEWRNAAEGVGMQGVQRGDFVFFFYDGLVDEYSSHVAYCLGTDDYGFWVIEGNINSHVCINYYDYYLYINRGFARPTY